MVTALRKKRQKRKQTYRERDASIPVSEHEEMPKNQRKAKDKRYAQSVKGKERAKKYSISEVGKETRKKYDQEHQEVGKKAREKYDKKHPEVGKKASENYHKEHPDVGKEAREKYAEKHPEVGLQSRKKYDEENPEVMRAARRKHATKNRKPGAAASKRFREARKRATAAPDDATEKQIRRQRRFIDLLPAREYSYVRNRAVLRTGRIVAQQMLTRNLSLAYIRKNQRKSPLDVTQFAQRAINLRNNRAAALRMEAKDIGDKFDELAMIMREKKDASIGDLCGPSGHDKNREPFFYDFAYRHSKATPIRGSRRLRYLRIRKRALSALLKTQKEVCIGFYSQNNSPSLLRKIRLYKASIKAMEAKTHKKVTFDIPGVGPVCTIIPLGQGEVSEADSWPCDHRCCIPDNPKEKLMELCNFFSNVSHIRSTLANYHIDACSAFQGCHHSNISYPESESGIDQLDDICPRIDEKLKQGHPISCLQGNCDSLLLFLRQLAVHYKGMNRLLRKVYRLFVFDRQLQRIDEALIKSDVEFLEHLIEADKEKHKPPTEHIGFTRPPLDVIPEEAFEDMPFAKRLKEAFFEKPEYACTCCRRLNYRKQVKEVFIKGVRKRPANLRQLEDATPTVHIGSENRPGPPWNHLWDALYAYLRIEDLSVHDFHFFLCEKCYQCIRDGQQFSPLSLFNGMDVDEIPAELAELNEFERLCVQPGKCMQIVCRLGAVGSKMPASDRQRSMKGQVLYYPLPLEYTIRQLSEKSYEAPGLHILLNSMPTKNRDIWQRVINLDKVRDALVWLKANNPLHKDIDLHRWMANIAKMFVADRNLEEEAAEEEDVDEEQVREACEQLGGRGAFPNATNKKPMLKKLDAQECARMLDSCTIRPLDTRKPNQTDLEVFQMLRIEEELVDTRNTELDVNCFTGIFPKGRFGKNAKRDQVVQPSEYVKNRLMHEDPRFRRDHAYIFHLLYESELRAISSCIYQTIRNTKRIDNMSVNEFVQFAAEGNKDLERSLTSVFRNMRGSPEYWKSVKMQVLCMIRKLGGPTWFLTLSAAEYDWEDMSEVLRTMNSDLPNVDSMRTSTLTSLDPVMTQNHFHHRFTTFFNEVILSKEAPPLGLVWDYFWRIEYQARGHIHYHILLWVKDAPKVGIDPIDEVKTFINQHATCRLPDPVREPILHALVTRYQMHGCNTYCKKVVKVRTQHITKCRFAFPRPIRDELVIREPLDVLGKRRQGQFEKRFYDLPRTDGEERINDYNATILLGWKANVDVSFVGESTTALANYVCGYVTKGEKGATELWESIDKNDSVYKQLYRYSFAKLQNRECSIIEAIDRLRCQPLFGKSRCTVYINARMRSARLVCVKKWSKLQEMRKDDPDSTDKYEKNWIDDYYPDRPQELEDVCLYDFISQYQKVKNPTKSMRFLTLPGGVKRRNDDLLVSHPLLKDPEQFEQYCYTLLLLFKPFRDELDEMLALDGTCKKLFEKELMQNPRLANEHQLLQNQIAKSTENEETMVRAQQAPLSQSQDPNAFNMPATVENAMDELAAAMAPSEGESSWEEDFAQMKNGQRKVFDRVKERVTDSSPFRMFVSGAGGTGKSFVAHSIRKFVQGHFFESSGPTVAIAAPTGLAAFNVSGVTLHRLFKLPVQHGTTGPWFPLNKDEQKQLRGALQDLKLLIIDEISMVSNIMLIFIDKRLREIFRSSEPFGGIKGIVVMGDFAQLKPVNADFIFETVSSVEITSRNLGVGSSNLWQRDSSNQ